METIQRLRLRVFPKSGTIPDAAYKDALVHIYVRGTERGNFTKCGRHVTKGDKRWQADYKGNLKQVNCDRCLFQVGKDAAKQAAKPKPKPAPKARPSNREIAELIRDQVRAVPKPTGEQRKKLERQVEQKVEKVFADNGIEAQVEYTSNEDE